MKQTSLLSTLLLLLVLSLSADAFNITTILANHTEFSLFNRLLTLTKVADDVNKQHTITVCVVNDTGMADISSKYPDDAILKAVLSFHVLLNYFDNNTLHNLPGGWAEHSTLFQSSGLAIGSKGMVKITNLNNSEVGFGAKDNSTFIEAVLVKSIQEIPYDISVIQISNALWPSGGFMIPPSPGKSTSSSPAPAPAPAPAQAPSKSPESSPPAPPSEESPVPVPSPDDEGRGEDEEDKSVGFRSKSGLWIALVLCACLEAIYLV